MDLDFALAQQHFVALGIIDLEFCFVLDALFFLLRSQPLLFLLQALQFIDALLDQGDTKRCGDLGIVLAAGQRQRRPGIGNRHGRQAGPGFQLQPNGGINGSQRQFANHLDLDIGIGRLHRDGLEVHHAAVDVDVADGLADAETRRSTQRVESRRQPGAVMGRLQGTGEGIG